MKSQRPDALADMLNIMAVRNRGLDAGLDCAAPYSRRFGAPRRHAKVSRVPPVQPQPVLAPLTPAAIFLVVTIDQGGEATVHDALPDLSGWCAPSASATRPNTVGGRLDRLRRLDRCSAARAGRAASVHRVEGPRHQAPATPATCCFTFEPSRWTCASSWPAAS